MAGVVRAAIEQMQGAGADVVEVDVPGLDSLLEGASLIHPEFKFAFMDYLAATSTTSPPSARSAGKR